MIRPVRARRNPAVADELLSLVHGPEPRELLLDLQNVRYLTTTGLTVLLALRQKVHAAGGRLSLCNPSSQVTEVLEATRLNTLFEVCRE
jgi:anti-anti-sigma factor